MEQATKKLTPATYVLLGLLCLVPLLGAILGLVLLIVGISRRTDKVLVILGIGGLVFGVGILGTTFFKLRNSTPFQQGWNEMAVQFLNSKVKEIEFYKVVKGEYPQDLDALTETDPKPMWPSYDPSKGMGAIASEFHYEKVDSGYYLFSTGKDDKPFTKDDIYPGLDKEVLEKTGLKLDKKSAN